MIVKSDNRIMKYTIAYEVKDEEVIVLVLSVGKRKKAEFIIIYKRRFKMNYPIMVIQEGQCVIYDYGSADTANIYHDLAKSDFFGKC